MEKTNEKFIEIKIAQVYAIYTQLPFVVLLFFALIIMPFIGKFVIIDLLFIFILCGKVAYGYFWFRLQKIKVFDDRLNVRQGVFSVKNDFLELYRVKDYEVYQSFLMRVFNLMAFRLHTSDKTNPILHIRGIKKSNIVDIIRKNVERQRKLKGVREFD